MKERVTLSFEVELKYNNKAGREELIERLKECARVRVTIWGSNGTLDMCHVSDSARVTTAMELPKAKG